MTAATRRAHRSLAAKMPKNRILRLVINADDLGMSPTVNDVILDLLSRGRLTSATLLANAPAAEEAARGIRGLSRCSFGAHLNLTEFRPLTEDPDLGPILDRDGCFVPQGIRSVRITATLARAIYHELAAQVERLIDLGVPVSHLDSHHHVHTVPACFPILKRLQIRFGIRRVRISRNVYDPGEDPSALLLLKKNVWNAALRYCYATRTTSGFTELKTFLRVARRGRITHPSLELMVHPGSPAFRDEEILETPWEQTVPGSPKLISYREV